MEMTTPNPVLVPGVSLLVGVFVPHLGFHDEAHNLLSHLQGFTISSQLIVHGKYTDRSVGFRFSRPFVAYTIVAGLLSWIPLGPLVFPRWLPDVVPKLPFTLRIDARLWGIEGSIFNLDRYF